MKGNKLCAEVSSKTPCPSPQLFVNGLAETASVLIPYLPLAPSTGTSHPSWSGVCSACQGTGKETGRRTHMSWGSSARAGTVGAAKVK